jgi:hypothetical protein
MGTDLSLKPSDSSEKSIGPLKNLALVSGCCSLIISVACIVAIPILFFFMMNLGSSAGDRAYIENLALGGTILLVISPIITVVAGTVGIVMVILWGIEKLKTSPGEGL